MPSAGRDDVAAVEGPAGRAGRAGRVAEHAARVAALDAQLALLGAFPEERAVAVDHRPDHAESLGMNFSTRNSMVATSSSPTYQRLREVTK